MRETSYLGGNIKFCFKSTKLLKIYDKLCFPFVFSSDVKIKDLMRNITKFTEDLRSFFHISEETIHSILEANISHSKVQGCFYHEGPLTAAAVLTTFHCLILLP